MARRGPQTFQKKLKEQQRKEKQQAKMAKRLGHRHPAEPAAEAAARPGEVESS